MNYPPVDPDFYTVGAEAGMSEEDIIADWKVYCDDLQAFHESVEKNLKEMTPEARQVLDGQLEAIQAEFDAAPLPVQHGMQPFLDEIKKLLK